MSLIGRPGVLGLTLACPLLGSYFSEWADPRRSTGSDHIPILLRFDKQLFHTPPPRPNWALSDWALIEDTPKSLTTPPPLLLSTSYYLGVWFDTNFNKISGTLALHTPLKRVTYWSKPW